MYCSVHRLRRKTFVIKSGIKRSVSAFKSLCSLSLCGKLLQSEIRETILTIKYPMINFGIWTTETEKNKTPRNI